VFYDTARSRIQVPENLNPPLHSQQIAQTILDGFDRHFTLFREITRDAKQRFETADWEGDNLARVERIAYYDARVRESVETLHQNFDLEQHDQALWKQVKLQYMGLLYEHKQPELAESFYNSVFCQLFDRRYYSNSHIFVRPGLSTDVIDMDSPAYRSYYPTSDGLAQTLRTLLDSFDLRLEWEDLERDINRLCEVFEPELVCPLLGSETCQMQVITTLFFRNKAAYIVGRIRIAGILSGFVLPLLRTEQGELYVDALIVDAQALAIIFSFTRAYFMVDTQVPSALIDFLQSILPSKTKSDLYTSIGFQKQGKTLFYRDFLNHLTHSSDQFMIAPGIEGMVMSVFTLPSFPYVFKVIKDKFAPPKKISRQTVKDKYMYVKTHDRVGRMADTLEFSHVAFPIDRVSPELLDKLKQDIATSLSIEGDQVIIRHLYIERRMVPLNMYLAHAPDDALEHVVREYGNTIKDLIKANIFPGDMLLKNFGVTRQNRIVFYDYDELMPMKEIRVRAIPPARTPEQEMASEPWYRVEENDFFPEQFEHFVMSYPKVRELLLKHHADLLDATYWQEIIRDLEKGVRADVFPYARKSRFGERFSGGGAENPIP
jgi:isocitrate dehydrogenase kinase/phosphatase